jgi:PKD repeat protein
MRRLLVLCVLCSCDGAVGALGSAEAPPPMGGPGISVFDCTPTEGDAPLAVSCTVAVKSTRAVSCLVDPGDGEMPLEIDDCLSASDLKLTIAKAGDFVVKLTATDSAQTGNEASVAVTVHPRPNQPPSIDTFAPGSSTGGAPFSTTLTWTVSDPDGDMLTCAFNGMPVDCAMGAAPWVVSAPGMQTVTLTVTDPYGGSASKTVTLTAVMAVGDISISRIEWGQTIVASNLKLVAGKPALLRVYVKSDTAGLMLPSGGVTVTGPMGTLPLSGPSTVPMTDDPTDLSKQYTVTVPGDWIGAGLALDVKIDATDALPESNEQNNTQHLAPAVGKGNVMQLTAVPVVQQGMMGTPSNLEPSLQRVWPLKGVDAQTRAPYTTGQQLTAFDFNPWSALLDELAQVRAMDGSSRDYYGFVHVDYGPGVAGIGYIGEATATGRDDSFETAQHELGHNMGRQHAPCGGAAGPDPFYPYAGAVIGSWGYDAVTKQLMAPNAFVDLMSYCNPAWVSDYNYNKVQTALESQPFITGTTSPYVSALVVSGSFSRGRAVLNPVYRVTAAVRVAEPSSRALRVRFADGRERLVPVRAHEIADLPEGEEHFVAQLEDLGPLAGVELLENGQAVATRVPLRIPEQARFEVHRVAKDVISLTWDAKRWPHAAVAHLGEQRTTLALGLTGGSWLIHTERLPEGGELEVSLSDGDDSAVGRIAR